MKFGLYAMNYGTCADPTNLLEVARHAEDAGFESLWTGEHIALPDPTPAWFTMPATLPFLDSIVALTLLATHTRRVNVASGVIQLPLHRPALLAKQLASIDQVAEGRLIAGFGAGYLEAEFAALGVPLGERADRMDEFVAALRALWTEPAPEFHGRTVDFAGIDAHPRPHRSGGPPIVLGGLSRAARQRAIRLADGWIAYDTTVESMAATLAVIERERAALDRPQHLGRLEITTIPAGKLDRRTVDGYAALGVDRLVLLPDPDVDADRTHDSVAIDQILRTIDRVAALAES